MARALLLTFLMLAPVAGAQLAVPGRSLPGLPGGLPGGLPAGIPGTLFPGITQQTTAALADDTRELEDARRVRIQRLLRRYSDVLEADPRGEPMVRGEVLAYSPSDEALARARGAGFSVLRESSLRMIDMRVVVLGAPQGTSTRRALELLHRLEPRGIYDFNNIYTESGIAPDGSAEPPREAAIAAAPAIAMMAGPAADSRLRVGLIDGGVEAEQPVFQGVVLLRHGCGAAVVPSVHGTEVASLIVGRSAQFGGAAPGATLYAADVYCGKPTGGAVDAIVEALAWLVGERVPVINVSLVGPPNALLQQVIERVVARGFLIVAAVGNDGPAAPPLYPAAYPGIVGVTAVDGRRRVLYEAERGPQVMFAAPGAGISAASLHDGFDPVRGTSFAAPIVAGLLAGELGSRVGADAAVAPASARAAVDALAREAIHLGAPGRNIVFGYGLVGANLPSGGATSRGGSPE